MISSAKSLGRDYEILDTKLDVEKILLLRWAERVQITKLKHDDRLNDPVIQGAIGRILASIQMLLSESQKFQHRYGLRPLDSNEAFKLEPTISGPRMRRFIQEFGALNLRIEDRRQNTSKTLHLRLIICAKEKFGALIKELSYFISKLNKVVPSQVVSHVSSS